MYGAVTEGSHESSMEFSVSLLDGITWMLYPQPYINVFLLQHMGQLFHKVWFILAYLKRKSVVRITTGSQALDELLGGNISEICCVISHAIILV